jgi:CRP/FNR family transcriptional regulator, cyclic AMP receptor protein
MAAHVAIDPLTTWCTWRDGRPAAWSAAALLDLDPDLGGELTAERFAIARSQLMVRVARLPRGEWACDTLASISPQNVGLLTIEGVIAREVLLEDTVSTELLGPGDVLRPWTGDPNPHLLQQQVRWQVLADARVALLSRATGIALARFPEINAAVVERVCARAHRLATMQAISHVNSVERRLQALFWHLAERWGRVTPDGIVVPLALSHRLLGELVGARRPTVTTAIHTLERDGKLLRRADATWLLTGEPTGTPATEVRRVIAHRRRLLREQPHDTPDVPAPGPTKHGSLSR